MKVHPYLPNSVPEIEEKMMKEMGINKIEELYSDIPKQFLLKKKLEVPGPFSEIEVKKMVTKILDKNVKLSCPPFLGGGSWPHYVPAVITEIVQRQEFLTSYTPYQAEISQGLLQALFEYQSMICELVGMDVANSSMYDWASALGEASRMANRLTHRPELLVSRLTHPERLSVLKTYAEPAGIELVQIDYAKESGQLDLERLKEQISQKTCGVYIENPTYLGFIETQVEKIAEITHDAGALFIVGVDPISLGILKAPGDYGADIVVGEGQPLGNDMNFGGPQLGIFACKSNRVTVRQLPGRIVGLTNTIDGSKRGFCMVLQTREQHIRRERATSNICTNEALCAVAAGAYLSLVGSNGLKDLCKLIVARSHYAMKELSSIEGVQTPMFKSSHFKEFTVSFDDTGKNVREINKELIKRNIHGGKNIKQDFPELGEAALYCITEMHTKGDIDQLIIVLKEVLEK